MRFKLEETEQLMQIFHMFVPIRRCGNAVLTRPRHFEQKVYLLLILQTHGNKDNNKLGVPITRPNQQRKNTSFLSNQLQAVTIALLGEN